MSAEKVIHTLLVGASAVTAVAGTRIYPGELPQGATLPALGVSHLSSAELDTISKAAGYSLMESRIEVTVLAYDYASLKSLLRLVRQACNYQAGVIAGYLVTSIRRELVGPDMRDSDLGIYTQTIDFTVIWQDPA